MFHKSQNFDRKMALPLPEYISEGRKFNGDILAGAEMKPILLAHSPPQPVSDITPIKAYGSLLALHLDHS